MDTKLIYRERAGVDLMMAMALVLILFCQWYWIFPQENTMVSQIASLLHFLSLEALLVCSGFIAGQRFLSIFDQKTVDFSSQLAFVFRSLRGLLPFYFLALTLNYFLSYWFGFPLEFHWKYFFLLQNFCGPIADFFAESWLIPVFVFAILFFSCCVFLLKRFLEVGVEKSYFAVCILLIVMAWAFKFYYAYSTGLHSLEQWNRELKPVVVYRVDSVFIGLLFSWFQHQRYDFWARFKSASFFLGALGLFFISFGIGYFKILIDTQPLFWTVFYLPLVSLSLALLIPFFSEVRLKMALFKFVLSQRALFYPIYLFHFSVVLRSICYFYPVASLELFEIFILLLLYLFITLFLSFILCWAFKKMNVLTN